MLDPWIIEEIRKREKREVERPRATPPEAPLPPLADLEPSEQPEEKRGVTIIDI